MWGHQAHSDSAVVPLFETNLHFVVIYNTAKDKLITLTSGKADERPDVGYPIKAVVAGSGGVGVIQFSAHFGSVSELALRKTRSLIESNSFNQFRPI